jgi:hypothetical protein
MADTTFQIKSGNLLIDGGTLTVQGGTDPPDPPVDPPVDPPDPPDPPATGDEGCDIINEHTKQPVRPVVTGPWRGWCCDERDPSRGRGDGTGREFADRVNLYRYFEYGNRVRTTCEVLVPTSWFYMGGAHFGGWVAWAGDDSIRLDWNAPSARGFRMTAYTKLGGKVETDRMDWTADEQVLFPDQPTHVIFECTHTPTSGLLAGFMIYSGGRLSSPVKVGPRSIEVRKGLPAIGQFAKWGRMNATVDNLAARIVVATVLNDEYEEVGS